MHNWISHRIFIFLSLLTCSKVAYTSDFPWLPQYDVTVLDTFLFERNFVPPLPFVSLDFEEEEFEEEEFEESAFSSGYVTCEEDLIEDETS